MKRRVAILLVVTGGVIGLAFPSGGASAAANQETAAAEYEFLGSSKCKMCHKEQYKSWEGTTHAKAFDILKPGERKEAKEKHGLDAAKDYTADESCLACHTTGYGKKGGYATPDAADEKAVKKMAKLHGAGCESCHGPGKGYAKAKKAIKKAFKADGTKYKLEQLTSVGLMKIEEAICAGCHNDKSPTFEKEKTLDFKKMTADEKAIHAHTPLKMRED